MKRRIFTPVNVVHLPKICSKLCVNGRVELIRFNYKANEWRNGLENILVYVKRVAGVYWSCEAKELGTKQTLHGSSKRTQ
jgi:hypothetical protein